MSSLPTLFRLAVIAVCFTSGACLSPSSRDTAAATPVDAYASPNWTIVRTLDNDVAVTALAMSPSGREVASGSFLSGAVTIWDTETGTLLRRLTELNGTADRLAYSANSRWLAVGHGLICRKPSHHCVDVLEVGTDHVVQVLETPPLPDRSPRKVLGYVASLQYSPDSQVLAVAFTHGVIGFYEAATGRLIRTLILPAEFHGPVVYSPNGQYLAFGELEMEPGPRWGQAVIQLVDAHTGANVRTFPGHMDAIEALAFDPTGQLLASGTRTGTRFNEDPIRIWNVETGALVTELRGHTGTVTSLAFLHQGRRLMSVSWDGTLKSWDVDLSKVLFTSIRMNALWAVGVNSDDTRMVSGGDGRKIQIWALYN